MRSSSSYWIISEILRGYRTRLETPAGFHVHTPRPMMLLLRKSKRVFTNRFNDICNDLDNWTSFGSPSDVDIYTLDSKHVATSNQLCVNLCLNYPYMYIMSVGSVSITHTLCQKSTEIKAMSAFQNAQFIMFIYARILSNSPCHRTQSLNDTRSCAQPF